MTSSDRQAPKRDSAAVFHSPTPGSAAMEGYAPVGPTDPGQAMIKRLLMIFAKE